MKEVYLMKYSIEEIFDTKYMEKEAREEEHLTDEEIAVLYLGNHFEIFENQRIYIPKVIIMDYLRKYNPTTDFFTRNDVQDCLEEAINAYIDSFVSNWIRKYPGMGGEQIHHFKEIANRKLATNLNELIEMDIELTEENLEHLSQYEDDMSKVISTLREKINSKK